MQNLTKFDSALKVLYNKNRVEKLVYSKFPLLALLPKNEEFYGKVKPIPVYYGNPQGRSSTFSRAKTRAASENSKVVDFQLKRTRDYGFVQIDNETMEASSNEKGAFLKAKQTEIDGIISSLSQSLARQIVRGGWGDAGQVGSFSTTTITLKDPNDVVHFESGQELVVAAAAGTGNIRAVGTSTNGLFITGVDRSSGVLTFGFNVDDATNGIPTIANNDFLFIRGDRDEAGTPERLQMVGLEAWVPTTAPTSTAFLGVDRSKDVTRLGGLRYDVSALPIEEGLLDGVAYASREGVHPDYYFMNPMKYSELTKALGAKREYTDIKASDSVGFRALQIEGPGGPVKIMSDPTIPTNKCYGLTRDSWELCSLGKLIKPLSSDGLEMLRLDGSDGVEVRFGYYANLACYAPGKNLNLTV
jgi:hypothetical protein